MANIDDDKRILDVGTGSGLIALMLAQRITDLGASITAIELDDDAVQQAQQNFEHSDWNGRLTCLKSDFCLWVTSEKFDHIVSNPPYFSHDLQNKDNKRTQARHQITLTFDQLLKRSAELTTEKGKLSLVLPVAEMQELLDIAPTYQWQLNRQCDIKHNRQGKVIRQLVELKNLRQVQSIHNIQHLLFVNLMAVIQSNIKIYVVVFTLNFSFTNK
ncbi:tRNA1(Val) (adenine(37)-N6)-methyltransferase [Psychrosphaera algicola]|uniref:Methyltransferase n=1 Tax=Psychrosphaera algicola TaxID=3023714 RepID=A0ABT5FEJ4_9GAMM|nr:methyltransferase [Psychrosphaera sp. G1-22]MDC2889382.1 methyltransferase [Psychrosphaera sp. G1-22]